MNEMKKTCKVNDVKMAMMPLLKGKMAEVGRDEALRIVKAACGAGGMSDDFIAAKIKDICGGEYDATRPWAYDASIAASVAAQIVAGIFR